MKNWIPVPGSKKETIIRLALEQFKEKGYEGVNIKDLAKEANMTTGVIYHHFGSKAQLYTVIRHDVEQRIIDRMEGAADTVIDPVKKLETALLAGLDASIKLNVCLLLSEENPHSIDKIEEFVLHLLEETITGLEFIVLPSWRSILEAVENNKIDQDHGRKLLMWLFHKKM
ncbi:TetR/AcrR family transcriptional regulator [Rossellomorea sp. KS-H15a]|uniref:TetR/AcrR family transcriptional regulator n=1 Tax=Rossellomorea sp. KS-H15a TaxID=2963940 RepID=UPI0020C686B6|nr:TetR/AcrR family transcriptional regulator [Rossellomorea sp. KS-H15a]UTE78874.1 TetR/AcrR family transcriptional regulator [Rossellomorea sp. KS-H15a]